MIGDLSPTGVRAYSVYCRRLQPEKVLDASNHDNLARLETSKITNHGWNQLHQQAIRFIQKAIGSNRTLILA